MGNVVSLQQWKQRKEEGRSNELTDCFDEVQTLTERINKLYQSISRINALMTELKEGRGFGEREQD